MTDPAEVPFRGGQTALVVKVPEAEPAVGRWRERFDRAAAMGVQAHVTVLYPFLDSGKVDGLVMDRLRGLFIAHAAFTARFDRCGRFPEVLYLAPEPGDPFKRLTEAVVTLWPEAPPYGGRFAEIVPHLTVADLRIRRWGGGRGGACARRCARPSDGAPPPARATLP
ncbi:2'-5' RNA ligase family protein [Sphaerisporangium perillae]|uniref:2'-5' RNA ligase family protein n=1 Tax=Sphaerisporangium perillae TaxID=2935860 RepID=UPI003558D2BF